MRNNDLPDFDDSDIVQHKRPWIAIIPLMFTGFLFFVWIFYLIIKILTNDHDELTNHSGIVIAICSVLGSLTFLACYKLHQGPNPDQRTTFPIWFIRGFGSFMAISLTMCYLQNKIGVFMFAKGFIFCLVIALSSDAAAFFDTRPEKSGTKKPTN